MRALTILVLGIAASAVAPTAGGHAQSSSQTTTQSELNTMWDKFKGSWTTTKGAVKEQWGKLTDDDLLEIEGRRDQLVGKLQTRYGISRADAEAQVNTWERRHYRDM